MSRLTDRIGDEASRRTFLKVTGATGIAALAGCTGDGSETDGGGENGGDDQNGGGETTTQQQDIGTVKYGFLNPMTGPYGGLAVGQRNANKLAVEWVNDSDDFDFEIEGFYEDTEADPSTGQQKAQKLKQQEDVGYLMGAISSSTALGLNSFAKQNQVIYNPGGAAIPITGSKCNEWVFRFETNTAQIAEASAPYTVNNIGSDVWFHIADYAYGNSFRTEWESRMKEAGDLNVVGSSKAEFGAENHSSYISQMANSDASVAILGMTGGDLITFLKQAEGQGLHDEMDLVSGTASFQVVRGAAGSAAEGVYSGIRYLPKLEAGDNQTFAQRYEDQFDSAPDNFARVGFDSVRMTARGIQEAGTKDPAKVAETLAGLEMDTIFGHNRFRECDHQAVNPVWMGQMEAGSGDVPGVNVLEKIEGENAIPPCSETECSL